MQENINLKGCTAAEGCDETCVHKRLVAKAKKTMPSEDEFSQIAELYKVFGDATRIKILYALLNDELCVCDIAQLLAMSQSAISHQLRVLKNASLVKNRRDGKTVYYSLADSHVSVILQQGREHILE